MDERCASQNGGKKHGESKVISIFIRISLIKYLIIEYKLNLQWTNMFLPTKPKNYLDGFFISVRSDQFN
jgi:hypothetical protein